MKKLALLVICLFALLLPFVCGADVNYSVGGGGNITEVAIIITINSTLHWQGYAGQVFYGSNATAPNILNATGSFVNGSDFFIQTNCTNPVSVSGFVFASNASSAITGPVAGNLTLLDHVLGDPVENATKTFFDRTSFALSTGTVSNVPTTYLFVNETGQKSSFKQGYFNQGNDLIFAAAVEQNLMGYNETYFDYQFLLPAVNQTVVPYYVSLDISFTCPAPAPAVRGGGGGSRGVRVVRCRPLWNCTEWGPCGSRGYQFRFCKDLHNCPGKKTEPPLMRVCMPLVEKPQVIPGKEFITDEFLKNIILDFRPAGGDVMSLMPFEGKLVNRNAFSVENILFDVETPEIVFAALPAHPYPRFLWEFGALLDRGMPGPRAIAWNIGELPSFERIEPESELPVKFNVVPSLMQPADVFVNVFALSGPQRIASAAVPVNVEIPVFDIYSFESERGVMSVYYVFDNRENKAQKINIELDVNRGRSTVAAEIIGPLLAPEDSVAIFAHKYKLASPDTGADGLAARLITKDRIFHIKKQFR